MVGDFLLIIKHMVNESLLKDPSLARIIERARAMIDNFHSIMLFHALCSHNYHIDTSVNMACFIVLGHLDITRIVVGKQNGGKLDILIPP